MPCGRAGKTNPTVSQIGKMPERKKEELLLKAKLKPHKLLSLLLALVMVVGMLPMSQVAYAASAVSNLTWDGNTAKWDSDGSASQYRVRLGIGPSYINSTIIANKVVDVTSIDY